MKSDTDECKDIIRAKESFMQVSSTYTTPSDSQETGAEAYICSSK